MIRILALLAAVVAFGTSAQARQPIFALSILSPNGHGSAYSVAIDPLGRTCRPFDATLDSCLYPVDAGQRLSLTATLAPGYSVVEWTGLCAGNGLTAVAVMAAEGISGCGLTLAYDARAAVTGW